MTLDARARSTANKMLTKFGKVITLSRITEGSYDPITGDMSASTTVSSSVYGLIKDYKPTEFTSGTIESGDKKVTISALNVALPCVGDTVTIDALNYCVISVGETWSGELAAMYQLQVRK
jgi:hypothetical protein